MSAAQTWFGRVAQQVRIHRVLGMRPARVLLAIKRLDSHAPHEGGDVFAANRIAVLLEQVTQHPAAGKGMFQVKPIDPAHRHKIALGQRPGFVVDCSA